MKGIKYKLPEKIFGIGSDLIMVWVGPGLLILALVLSFSLVMVPKISDIQKIAKEIQKVEKETKGVRDKTNYLLSIDQEELKANSSLLASGILPEKNAYHLVKIIRSVATDYQYEISEFSISLGDLSKKEEVKKANIEYEKVPVKIVLSGVRERFLDLVAGLENNLPVLSVDNFEMSSNGSIANIELTVSGFYLAEAKKVNPETLGLAELTLKKEESELLSKIGNFKVYGENLDWEADGQAKTYEREDPFFTP